MKAQRTVGVPWKDARWDIETTMSPSLIASMMPGSRYKKKVGESTYARVPQVVRNGFRPTVSQKWLDKPLGIPQPPLLSWHGQNSLGCGFITSGVQKIHSSRGSDSPRPLQSHRFFSENSVFPEMLDGFLERFGSLERMEGALEECLSLLHIKSES